MKEVPGASWKQVKIPFVVWNTSGTAKKQVIAKELHLFRDYNLFVWDGYEAAEAVEMPNLVLRDANGNAIPAKIENAGISFGYDVPDVDRFRQPYMAKKVLVTFGRSSGDGICNILSGAGRAGSEPGNLCRFCE